MAKGAVKQKDLIKNYSLAQGELFKYFKCEEEYFIKVMPASKWSIKNDGEFYFLYYWDENDDRKDAVIVRKNGEPLIYKAEKYTMVIGIDCVKIGFVFHNGNKRSSI